MYLGYAIGADDIPLLEPFEIDRVDELDGSRPTLIVGYDNAVTLFPKQVTLSSKVVDADKRIYYCFSKDESEDKFKENTANFLRRAFAEMIGNVRITNIVDLDDIDVTMFEDEQVFIYETINLITLTTKYAIYYINKNILNFFNDRITTLGTILNLLDQVDCEIVSWTTDDYFGAVLKNNLCYRSQYQIKALMHSYGDVDLYMGRLCLQWLETLKRDKDEYVWQEAYEMQDYLSTMPIKVDIEAVESLSSTSQQNMFDNILDRERDGYIIQKYNGTDKVTGRMYASRSGFSVQSLGRQFRHIIVAEDDCYLIEYDYKHFEYTLLSQICDFDIGDDPHRSLSNLLFGNDSQRELAKSINYSILYGKDLEKVVSEVLQKDDVAIGRNHLTEILTMRIKPIETLDRQLDQEFNRYGYIKNPFGRKIIPEKRHAFVNNYVQSTAADIVINKLGGIADHLEQYNPINRLVLQNHDSVLLNLHQDLIDTTNVAKDVKDILQSPIHDLSGRVSLKYGLDWANLS